jgi:hypothetical protein
MYLLEALVAYMKAKGSVWFATHAEVAAYCKAEAGL